MKIKNITAYLEELAPLSLQESYDNAGLLVGNKESECTGIIVSLDVTEKVVDEAVAKKCNLIVSHHPIIFKGLKKITGRNYVERTVIAAKNDISIYAIHTNLDNIAEGVNRMIAEKLNLKNCQVLQPKEGTLKKLVTFVPVKNAEEVRNALFRAGAGAIGNYDEVSFNVQGEGMFKANEGSKPFVGEIGQKHVEQETRIEVIFPSYLQNNIASSLKKHHPYEEVAYYITSLDNVLNSRGSGLVGELENEMSETELLDLLKKEFGLSVIKHTPLILQKVKKIALCGGSGFFLLPYAKSSGAQVYITADVKYHEFFDAEDTILLADIGHYESEQFTMNLLTEFLQQKFPNFAVQKTEMNTNPVNYY